MGGFADGRDNPHKTFLLSAVGILPFAALRFRRTSYDGEHFQHIDSRGRGDFSALAAKCYDDLELNSRRNLSSIKGGYMSNEKTGSAASVSRALQPTESTPLDFVPDKIPFDTPYGTRSKPSLLARTRKENWK